MSTEVQTLARNRLAKAEIRYPDDFYLPTREETEHCATTALAARKFVRTRLKQAGLGGL